MAKSYVRNCMLYLGIKYNITKDILKEYLEKPLFEYIKKHRHILTDEGYAELNKCINTLFVEQNISGELDIEKMKSYALEKTDNDAYQAMEGMIHNFCSLASRAGSQVPFSSINYGTDTTEEGRMVIKNVLLATKAGLGNGETAIFPISVFRMRKGITDKGSPNYDLFKLSCEVSSVRLYPNHLNTSSSFNDPYVKEGDPRTLVATMGCRTRVLGNVHDPNNEISYGRGNLFMVTLNLPYYALEAVEYCKEHPDTDKITKFYEIFDERIQDAFGQLDERFEIVAKRKAKNYPFLMGQHVYLGSEKLHPDDEIREVLKQGTLTIGFIGLAETLVALVGKHHGESKTAWELGYQIISHLNDACKAKSDETKMNYSCMGTPAEGCCGRLLKSVRKRFGTLKGISDHEYLSNSHHRLECGIAA